MVHPNLNTNTLQNLYDYCQENQVLFVDKEFPPRKPSLIGQTTPKDYKNQFDVIEWKRASHLFGQGNYELFRGITPSDIRQGSLGNCYFLCALASLAEYPDLIRRLFDFDTTNPYGIQSTWLNINGAWKRFIMDEYFPSYYNGAKWDLAFSKTEQQELWVILLEKAYAKAYGSYWEIIGGDPVHALRDLTGAPYDRVEDFSDLDKAWQQIYEANKKNYMLTCFTKSTEITEEKSGEGIVSGHAYTILDVREVVDSRGRPQRIIQIRNPWGKFEWNGAFSDNSDLWTPELKSELGVDKSDDGIFWMRLEDFTKFYQGIGILEIIPGHISNSVGIKGQGQKMIRMHVGSDSHLFLGIDQMDTRIVDQPDYSYSYFRLTIGKLNGSKGVSFIDSVLSPERNIFIEKNFTAGDYIILIEPYWSSQHVDNFTVSTYSDNEVELEILSADQKTYQQAEYLVWKNFAKRSLGNMTHKGSREAGYGDESAQLDSYQLQNKKFASILYAYANKSDRNAIHQSIKFNSNKGFNPLGQAVTEEGAELIINPQDVDILLFKMDPRSKGFSLSHQITNEEVIPHSFSEDKTVLEFMNSMGGLQPTPDNPEPDMSSRMEKRRRMQAEREKRKALREKLAREKAERARILAEKQRILEEQRQRAEEIRRKREEAERYDDNYGYGFGFGNSYGYGGSDRYDPYGGNNNYDPYSGRDNGYGGWSNNQGYRSNYDNGGGYGQYDYSKYVSYDNSGRRRYVLEGEQNGQPAENNNNGGGCTIF